MEADLRYFLELMKVNMKAAMAQRGAYLVRGIFSLITHTVYILVWFVFFSAVPSIGGWQLQHILLAYGIAISSWGFVSFLAYGFRTLPHQIDYGELDCYLTQPRPVLLNVAMGSSKATGPGEIVFGFVVIAYAGMIADVPLLPLLLVMVCACLIFASMVLATSTLGFWLRNFRGTAEELAFNFNVLASRPGPLFPLWMKFILFTIIPVSFMTHLPIEVLLGHRWEILIFTIFGAVAAVAAGVMFFHFGLRHYESGSRFGVRG